MGSQMTALKIYIFFGDTRGETETPEAIPSRKGVLPPFLRKLLGSTQQLSHLPRMLGPPSAVG
jgi:hypothetical protein